MSKSGHQPGGVGANPGRLDALIRQVEAGGHSVFAPSAAHRWFVCPASLRACLEASAALIDEDGTPVNTSNFYSVEGTAAHDVAAQWLTSCYRPDDRVGEVFERDGIEVTIDEEMLDHVGRYTDWCVEAETPGAVSRVEQRVDVSHLFPIAKQGGTADFFAYDPIRRRLTIIDLKYGQGVRVFATENHQEMLYALGAIEWLRTERGIDDVREIELRIAQPRLDHFDVWTTDIIRLHHFAHEVRERAREAWAPGARYNPDPKACRFCPVKATCGALAGELERMAMAKFSVETVPEVHAPPERLTTDDMASILRWRKTVESWFGSIEAELFARADAGVEVPGFKITQGRSSRRWRDPVQAANLLEIIGLNIEDIFSQEMISPAQAERALRKRRVAPPKVLGSAVEVTAGPRTLAPLVDPRSALAASSAKFGPIEPTDDLS